MKEKEPGVGLQILTDPDTLHAALQRGVLAVGIRCAKIVSKTAIDYAQSNEFLTEPGAILGHGGVDLVVAACLGVLSLNTLAKASEIIVDKAMQQGLKVPFDTSA
ncbi:MAG: hypothetical protein JW991_02905 [Candidatus Pacebacteria bacterium]|nr:hypothetical protein [Candidatus Paceibacterota bacterium]